ncbi:MAG: glycerol-3-phosphate 1-O-acyltransferase PlsY [Desulfomicrobium sp.]|nr:glycerol-3-phosphate 1-O-acyltransferase PlsY [Pseudomonadota bacterium]MBV1712756.1 glycerol-3-phosphate 1-O-acyltransferase PlsY [Desulfomicrobium sp.]MBU4571726.1 glycerol-3-phosphate 1-O-acyltransferase PlsY [Pseudomonadota bacterium]MBU4595875.1 glycerol-3-phosphate 1-O-acyltransferase PlsY [Pseudomonadota bacterium]MBV1721179.1 glycerol-3-phosphate 1-O-acyltransferase PlsY [Desulfomicrobium sp.]
MVTIFWLAISYLLGAMPFGLLISKTCCGIDPREQGSGNIGATNVARICGTKYGALTLTLDMLKGFVPVALATSFSDSYFFLTLVALAAVCGHMFSVFLHGKGGKGVATWVGAFVAISTSGTIICALGFLAALYFYNFVSLASLVMVALMPLVLLFQGLYAAIPLALVLMGLVFWKHSENIQRLMAGEEHPWKKK